jgi:hypothetical protein
MLALIRYVISSVITLTFDILLILCCALMWSNLDSASVHWNSLRTTYFSKIESVKKQFC